MHSLKAILVDDDHDVLTCMQHILQRRNYIVETYDDPVNSPLFQSKICPCSLNRPGCPDIIISDFNMPSMNGLDLLEYNIGKGCRCRHLALISGVEIPEPYLFRLAKYGIRYFGKPLDFDYFYDWLDRVEYEITEHCATRRSA